MMGRTHAATGVLAGLLTAPLLGVDDPAQIAVFAATTAGYALLPDLDHPGARASRLLGPASKAASHILRAASAALYTRTKGPRDEDCTGTHRHLSHTVLFALVLGGLAAWGSAASPWIALVVVALGLLLAENALGDWVLPVATGAALWWSLTTSDPLAALDTLGLQLGIAVTVGCVTHCLGDALTESGCPLLFPMPIAGETWYELRPPRFLRFRTGKAVENVLVFPAVIVACALAVPGVAPMLVDLLDYLDTVA